VIDVSFDFAPCDCSYNRSFGEYIASIFSVPAGDRTPQLCYHGIAAD
jgi:hypothetical protein